ncbi:division/cell wall cluster transcriptional repressor MraZ [Candidatus Microgenomates bacterium]|nr:division/cell wall cluster transcriptional repressor MraZ [Candidatus Microgenomates bacterium]
MFVGQYLHSLEKKGRLAIPNSLRKRLGKKAVLTKGLDGCLFLFAFEKWQEFTNKLAKMSLTKKDSRSFARFLSFSAAEITLDRQGRALIPNHLRKFAGIRKNVVIAGALERIEIWDQKRFNNYLTKVEKNSEKIAERLEELGL